MVEQQQKSNQMYKDFISGLLAGFVSVTVCAPLDVARCRFNIMYSQGTEIRYKGLIDFLKRLKMEEGVRGFYKGYNATVFSIPLFHSLFFTIYNKMKPIINQNFNYLSMHVQHIISSSMTGLICDVITNPLWIVRTRLMVQHMHSNQNLYTGGVFDTLIKIYQQEGYQALFKGLGSSFIGLTHVGIYFPVYEYLKEQLQTFNDQNKTKINSFQIFISSLISKALAQCITYPHIVIRTLLQDNRQNYSELKVKDRLKIKNIVREFMQLNQFINCYYLTICLQQF
ncbi:mitochondrial carrier protein, putative [Ichthyophthirius multifiliis]|uniref:Mitochondrial carrier protein, putative n=1 Tax=Ichthyophthirius multifiliis TaxID=5932 RepID=G0QJW9_ICHMU|nr:mitochondrial carrier protein, putative [Ichthyophthirius multifiliis]EGR34485.1 mitochondrial carrier protein, putative [Ichthyophthirius multifiliis]|eukprot:XP_004039789.1 mitochondrial carrier protein, putative [Ichthyophthirius multifiliis]